jgi:hypothetical protein
MTMGADFNFQAWCDDIPPAVMVCHCGLVRPARAGDPQYVWNLLIPVDEDGRRKPDQLPHYRHRCLACRIMRNQ